MTAPLKNHNRELAKLAVEIARKVLVQEIDEHHYKIEEIIKAAIESLPATTDEIVVQAQS